jgi:hypothetical protein
MDEQFKIKSYGYGELAMLYFPRSTKKSASAQLSRWIKINKPLFSKLNQAGFIKGKRLLTPMQVKIIIENIGTP